MKKYDNIIGIDPDVDKNGVAFLNIKTRKLEISNLSFPLLLDYFLFLKKQRSETGESFILIVEAGYLNKSHWHVKSKDNNRVASSKGASVGRNHEVARKIIEMAEHYEIEVIPARPLIKCWKGPEGKITNEELSSFTGITGRTNQEGRDAALLAWSWAGLPIKINLKNKK